MNYLIILPMTLSIGHIQLSSLQSSPILNKKWLLAALLNTPHFEIWILWCYIMKIHAGNGIPLLYHNKWKPVLLEKLSPGSLSKSKAKLKLKSVANPPYLYKLSEHHWDMWFFPSGHTSPQTAQLHLVPFLLWLLEVPEHRSYQQLPGLL